MKTVLITCFEPFENRPTNASTEAVRQLPDRIGQWDIRKLQLPVVYGQAPQKAIACAKETGAELILCVGEAGGREDVTVEQIGINLRAARIADNAGCQPENEPCVTGGADGLFATIPVADAVKTLQKEGLPVRVSYTAGTFICNDVLYSVLHTFAGTDTRCGFVHVPAYGDTALSAACLLRLLQYLTD